MRIIPKQFFILLTTGTCCLFLLTGQVAQAQNVEAARLYNRAIDYYSKGNTTMATQLFEDATRSDPNYPDAWFNLATLYYQAQDYARSEEGFRQVLRLSPNDGQAWYNLGLALEKQGKFTEARDAYSRVPSNDRKHSAAQDKLRLLGGGAAYQPGRTAQKPTYQANPFNQQQQQANRQPEIAATTAASSGVAGASAGKLPVETFASGFAGPTGMAVGPGGLLYVANYTKNAIYKVGKQGNKEVWIEGDGLMGPVGLVYNPRKKELYVANYLGNSISRVTADGKISLMASGLKKPYYLMLDLDTNSLFVSEQESNTVSRIPLGS